MSTKTVAVIKRVARIFIFGAVATIGLATYSAPQTWTDLASVLNMMSIAGIWGGVVAVIAGVDKWLRWKN